MFGLAILLILFSQEPMEERSTSVNVPHIEKALEVLEVMDECSVERNMSRLAREVVNTLPTAAIGNQGDLEHPKQPEAFMGQDTSDSGFNADFNAFGFFNAFPLGLEMTDFFEEDDRS